MNEKLIDILEMVQRTAVQRGDTAADVAYGVGQKTEGRLTLAKPNISRRRGVKPPSRARRASALS